MPVEDRKCLYLSLTEVEYLIERLDYPVPGLMKLMENREVFDMLTNLRGRFDKKRK